MTLPGSKENILLKEINHIVSDVDGTLLNDNGELNTESKKLIKELMNLNVMISLATGRLHSAVTEIANKLSLNGYIISLDGALIKKYPDDKIIHESYLSVNKVKKALAFAEKNLVNIVLCHESNIFYTERNSAIPAMLNKYGASYTQVESYKNHESGTLEIICSSDNKSSIKLMEEKFNFPYSFGCNTSYFRSRRNENIFYLEIRKAGSSKGKALSRVSGDSKIKIEQTAVIGDWYNDIPMFNSKAVKVAMANAIPELIDSADIVTTKSNKEDGIAEFFEMVLKSKRDLK